MSQYLEFKTPAADQAHTLASEFQLDNQGFVELGRTYWNLSESALVEESLFRKEGHLAAGGPIVIHTGKHTDRAAADRFIVKESSTDEHIHWGEHNRPISPENYNGLLSRVQAYCQGKELFVQDCFVCSDPDYRMPVRFITEEAWQSLFIRNMYIVPEDREISRQFVPDFTVICVPGFKADARLDGTRSETAIVINFSERTILIIDSLYAGEIKKSVFSALNYLLTFEDALPMQCAAAMDMKGEVSLLFGESGTGKTSLSTDPEFRLVGDDAHGWSSRGIFNFEAGCYAKCIGLSAELEPLIFSAARQYGSILENVACDPVSRSIDLCDDKLTQNTRASFPLSRIPNAVPDGPVNHPRNIVFLVCDASGVLPPIARLTQGQAMYHLLSGYNSTISGKGSGAVPKIGFSACFGASSLVRHPFVYARMLQDRIHTHGTQCWLLNTGSVGLETGARIGIRESRTLLAAALQGKLDKVKYRKDKLFGFDVPVACPGFPEERLDPAAGWKDKDEYWKRGDALAARFIENFKLYSKGMTQEVLNSGPSRLHKKG